MKKILDIPYQSQYSDDVSADWHRRICGIACVKMILDYFCFEKSIKDLLDDGLSSGGHDPRVGWSHNTLIKLLKENGVNAQREEFKKEGLFEAGILKLRDSINKNFPIVISVEAGFDENKTSHLILITGYEASEDRGGFYYNDPLSEHIEKKDLFVDMDKFEKYWRKLAIFTDSGQVSVQAL